MKKSFKTVISSVVAFMMLFLICTPTFAFADTGSIRDAVADNFSAGTYTGSDSSAIPYRYFNPIATDSTAKYPVILYLHSEDESGTDNSKQVTGTDAATIWAESDHLAKNPAYILAPQIPVGSTWTDDAVYKNVLALLNQFILSHPNIDKDRIYIEGISMGGTGTWNMILKNPTLFAAAMPICGNADDFLSNTAAFAALKNMAIYVIHSNDDPISQVKGSTAAVTALKAGGNTSVQTAYWTAGSVIPAHNAWIPAFHNYEVIYNWMFAQSLAKTNNGTIAPNTLYTSKSLGNGITQVWDISCDTAYVIEKPDKAVIVDTTMGSGNIYKYIKDNILINKDIPIEIFITHNDGDNTADLPSFVNQNQVKKLYISSIDKAGANKFGAADSKVQLIKDGDTIKVGGENAEFISVPGHTMGSMAMLYESNLFSGDSIGSGDLLISSGPMSIAEYEQSLQHLLDKVSGVANLTVLPGHTGEIRGANLTIDYINQLMVCAKGIVDTSLSRTIYLRSNNLYATVGRAGIVFNTTYITKDKAFLKGLSVGGVNTIGQAVNLTLSSSFSQTTTAYTVAADNTVTSAAITATVLSASYRSLTVNGISVNSSVPYNIALNAGVNVFNITVTANSGTIKAYIISINKAGTGASYSTVTEIFDFGAAVTKVIVDLGQAVTQNSVDADTFNVHVVRTDTRLATTPLLEEGDRKVTKAYISDKDGNAVTSGNYAVLEMEVGPSISLGSPLNYYNSFNEWINCNYTISQNTDITSNTGTISRLTADRFLVGAKNIVDDFTTGKGSYDNVNLTYASYKPAEDSAKHPLIIWLHGAGEGGIDATIPISANKADNFASKDIQAYFGGAYVLAPQTPTLWMDGFKNKGDGTSIYEVPVMELIKEYVASNKDIDINRIYVGGDSNGGYLTMLLARDYTDYFAAAFPTSETLNDTLITDSDILKMKDIPMWITGTKADTTADPALCDIPTYNRLFQAGAKDIHFSLFNNVIDTSGLYKKADGSPYEYDGHMSWIYVYNNQCTDVINGKITTIMEWMAAQTLNKGLVAGLININ